MTRRLAWIAPLFGLGLMVCAYAPQPLFAVIAAAFVMAVLPLCMRRLHPQRLLVCMTAYLCGCLLWVGYDTLYAEPLRRLDGQTQPFSGEIMQLDRYADDTARYVLRGTLRGRTARVVCYGADASCAVGDTLTMTASFSLPQDSFVFSASDYYGAQGILLTAEADAFTVIPDDGFSLRRSVTEFRDARIADLRRIMPEDEAGLLCAMLCGDSSGLSSASRTALYRTGIGHVTAVSGLHLSLLCSAAVMLLRRLRAGKYTECGAVLVLTVLFALFADETYSVLRAGIMLVLVYGARAVNRKTDALSSLGAAFLLLTMTAPYAVRSASFLLSFASTFAISVAAPYFTAEVRFAPLRAFLSLACVSVAVLPVSVLYFNEASTVAPFSNLVLIPLCMLILLLGLLFALTGIPLLASAAVPLCTAVQQIADFCARLPFSHLPTGYGIYRVLFPLAAVIIVLIYARTKNRRAVQLSLIVSLMAFSLCAVWIPIARRGEIRVALLGEQSHCTVVVMQGETAAVADLSGGRKSADYVQKYLADSGISQIGTLCLFEQPSAVIPIYDETLCYQTVGQLCVPQDTPLTDGLSVCGAQPQPADECRVEQADLSLLCNKGSVTLTAYGTQWQLLEKEQGWILCGTGGAEVGQNCELILSADGSSCIRPL